MKKILHILKDPNSSEAMDIIKRQADRPSHQLSILLIQEAVGLKPEVRARIYVLKEDAEKRKAGVTYESVDYPGMLELIYSSDAVVTW